MVLRLVDKRIALTKNDVGCTSRNAERYIFVYQGALDEAD